MSVTLPLAEVAVATGTSAAVATAVDASPLLTALISFGVAVVTVVGGELITLAVTWIKKKKEQIEKKDKTDEKKEEKDK